MRLLVLCSLALAAWAGVGARAQDGNPDRHVSCLPCRDEDRAATLCPVVRPEQCRSGRLTRCGCCHTCLVYIRDGDACIGVVPTNGVCNPPMRCTYNVCHNP